MPEIKYDMITVLGPTATGKTRLAAGIAATLNGEIISADSRQVYKDMDIGTGKDYKDYIIDDVSVPYHLIDITDAGNEYNLHQYQQDFYQVFEQVINKRKIPVLCGGSGLYLESVLNGYNLLTVPVNDKLRKELEHKSDDELSSMLASLRPLHNTTDITNRKRAVRAIEIEMYSKEHPALKKSNPTITSINFGFNYPREILRERIEKRLHSRLKQGMVDEIDKLVKSGVPTEQLINYGLEYKFVTMFLLGKLEYDEMVEKLFIAICQFAKRQMTWFRKMERNGTVIHWINWRLKDHEKIENALSEIGIKTKNKNNICG